MSGKYPTVVKGECVMATYDSVNDKRKKNWAVNALRYNWMKAFPGKRNSSLWLFSSWEGKNMRITADICLNIC